MWLHEVPDPQGDGDAIAEHRRQYARRNLALIRACTQVDACLKSHGVIGMLRGEQANASLNSAMVAVLGLAVKKQEVGYRLFATAEGHAQLQREFARYFDASPDSVAQQEKIAAADEAVAQVQQALAAWRSQAPP